MWETGAATRSGFEPIAAEWLNPNILLDLSVDRIDHETRAALTALGTRVFERAVSITLKKWNGPMTRPICQRLNPDVVSNRISA